MPTKRKVANLLALAVLSYLAQGPRHPYELGRMLREHGDARSIKFNHGSLYMVVQQLERAGFRELIDAVTGRGVHPLFLVEEDYRLALLDAEIAFVERLVERITDPDTGWAPQWAELHE